MDDWAGGCVNGWMGGWVMSGWGVGRMDGMDRWVYGQIDEWMDRLWRLTSYHFTATIFIICLFQPQSSPLLKLTLFKQSLL